VRISAFGSTTCTNHLHLHPLKEICMETEDQPKELKETKTFNFRSVLKMVLASIMVMIAINFWNRVIIRCWLKVFLPVVSTTAIRKCN
jgi:hypothetical protein